MIRSTSAGRRCHDRSMPCTKGSVFTAQCCDVRRFIESTMSQLQIGRPSKARRAVPRAPPRCASPSGPMHAPARRASVLRQCRHFQIVGRVLYAGYKTRCIQNMRRPPPHCPAELPLSTASYHCAPASVSVSLSLNELRISICDPAQCAAHPYTPLALPPPSLGNPTSLRRPILSVLLESVQRVGFCRSTVRELITGQVLLVQVFVLSKPVVFLEVLFHVLVVEVC